MKAGGRRVASASPNHRAAPGGLHLATPPEDPPGSPAPPSERPRLADIISTLPERDLRGAPGVRIAGLAYRSEDTEPHGLFFCVPGSTADGHDFADDAIRRGAKALVVERWLSNDATQVLVPSVRAAMGPIAAEFFERPAERMTVVGVTGTNGKTTTTYLTESIFRAAGMIPGVIGTTGVRIDGRPSPLPHTTPEAPDLHRLLRSMADGAVQAVSMEVSSHGLDQHRVSGIRFACAVFTNLSQDHLDYHGTIDEYFFAKARLFDPAISERAAINVDDEAGSRLLRPDLPTITFGTSAGADLQATNVQTAWDGIEFDAGGSRFSSRLRGMFNVMNCLASVAAARSVGIDDGAIAEGLAALQGVPGRLEPVEEGQGFTVLVDYAHTPDSLENVLSAMRPLTDGRLIAVFGCGGDRDRGKRPLMGEVATRLADLTVLTSDNPRSEDPRTVIAEIEPGAKRGGREYRIEHDRREAIRMALREAGDRDIVVIAGKGHETGQQFADETVPFDDRIVAAEELRALGGAG